MIHFLTKQKETFGFNVDVTIRSIVKYIKAIEDRRFVVDTETTGLDHNEYEYLLWQVGDVKNQFVIDHRAVTAAKLRPLFNLFEDGDYQKIIANVGFEYKGLAQNYGVILVNVRDIILNDRVIHAGMYEEKDDAIYKAEHHGMGRFMLQGIASRYLGHEMDKEERGTFIKHKGDFRKRQIEYAADDIVIPARLLDPIDRELKRIGSPVASALEDLACPSYGDMEFNGIKLDADKWEGVYKAKLIEKNKSELVLDDYVVSHTALKDKFSIPIQMGLFAGTQGRRCKINWGSAPQKISVLEAVGVDVWAKNKKTREFTKTSGKTHIEQFQEEFEVVPLIMRHGELLNSIQLFGRNFLKNINKHTGRIHTSYDPIKSTGRTSSRNPNLQNIKKDELYRSAFVAEKGNDILTHDYSNLELRIIADRSKDEVLITAFNDGIDVHSLIARRIYKVAYGEDIQVSKSVNEDIRQQFKTITFAIAYGAAAYTLHKRLGVTLERAEELITMYFTAFPALKQFFFGLAQYGLTHGFIRTYPPFSRIRWFPDHAEYKRLSSLVTKSKYEFWPFNFTWPAGRWAIWAIQAGSATRRPADP